MSDVVEKARERLAEIEAEAVELRTFLAVHDRLLGKGEGIKAAPGDEKEAIVANQQQSVAKASPGEIVAGAKQLMREKQRPLTRTELVKLLTLRGLRIAGRDKSKNVGTIIWRSQQFQNVEGVGYWPKEMGPWVGDRPPTLEGLMS